MTDRSLPGVAWQWCLIGLFTIGIFLPLLRSTLGPVVQAEELERRRHVHWTDVVEAVHEPWRLNAVLRAFAHDNFGFRNELVRLHATIKVLWLGVSSSHRVLLGKSGWVFLDSEGAVESYRSLRPYTSAQLLQMGHLFEQRRRWLAERGIRYLVVAAPNKHSIYPEFLPDSVTRINERSRLDQLAAHMAENTAVEFLDLQPVLLAAKARGRVYFRLDTHWNARGAYAGYRAIADRLADWYPGLSALPRSAFGLRHAAGLPRELGLARMLGLSGILAERVPRLDPLFEPRARDVATGLPIAETELPRQWGSYGTWVPGAEGPRALVLRDSFGTALIPLLSESLRAVHYAWPPALGFSRSLVGLEAPDVVIQEFVERILRHPPSRFAPLPK